MRSLLAVALVFASCGPELRLPATDLEFDAGSSRPAGVDAGPLPMLPLEACRAICPEGSTVSVRYDGACVCAR